LFGKAKVATVNEKNYFEFEFEDEGFKKEKANSRGRRTVE
jgi:hypothetical protein